MALSAEATISIVGAPINLPTCVLVFYHMWSRRNKSGQYMNPADVERSHEIFERTLPYPDDQPRLPNHHYPSPRVPYSIPSRYRTLCRSQQDSQLYFESL